MEQREERASVGLPDGSWALPGVVATSPQGMLAPRPVSTLGVS